MAELSGLGRVLIVAGLGITVIGIGLVVAGRLPLLAWLGRLPGDFVVRRGPVVIYLPLATSILLSILLTILFSILRRD